MVTTDVRTLRFKTELTLDKFSTTLRQAQLKTKEIQPENQNRCSLSCLSTA